MNTFIKRHQKSLHALIILLAVAVNLSAFVDYSKAVSSLSFVRTWGSYGAIANLYPLHGAYSPGGKLYISDPNIHKVSVFSASGQFEFQFGSYGSDNGEFSYPWGIVFGQNGNLYVADSGNNRIQVFKPDGTYLFSFGTSGNGQGQFSNPRGIVIDEFGNVYVADSLNHRIEVFNANGIFQNAFGSQGAGQGQLKYPEAIAMSLSGDLYVADNGNSRIEIFDQAGVYISEFGSYGSDPGEMVFPTDIDFAPNGQIYVVGASDHQVQIFDYNGSYISRFETFGGSLPTSSAQSITIAPTGMLYMADAGSNVLDFYMLPTITHGYHVYNSGWNGTIMKSPTGVAISPNGNTIYMTDTANHRIRGYDDHGNWLFDFGERGYSDGSFYYPEDIAIAADGTVYVVDDYNRIQVFTENGVFTSSFGMPGAGDGQLNRAMGITVGPDGNLYVADTGNNRISVFAPNGTPIANFGAIGSGSEEFNNPSDVAVAADGKMYIADTGNNRIVILNADGSNEGIIGSQGNADGSFYAPKGITLDPAGNIYVADTQNDRIQVFTSSGQFITKIGTHGQGNAQFDQPQGIAVSSTGMVIVADTNNSRLQQFTVESANNPVVPTTPPNDPPIGGGGSGGAVFIPNTITPEVPVTPGDATNPVSGGEGGVVETPIDIPQFSLPEPIKKIIASTTKAVRENVVEPTRVTVAKIELATPTPLKTYIPKTIMTSGLLVGSIAMVTDNLFVAPMSLPQLALLPLRLWANLLSALGIKKRRRPWGTVYDSMTKQPIDPIYLELVNKEGFVVSKVMTDAYGRYSFKVAPGHYMLRPRKEGYIFPSLVLAHTTRDEIYDDLYFGNFFEIKHENEFISKNVPVDRTNIDWREYFAEDQKVLNWLSRRDKLISNISQVLFVAGFIIASLALLLAPRLYSIVIFLLYVLMYLIRRAGVSASKLGKVLDKATKAPLAFAVVRVYSVKLGNEVLRKVTNKYGQFFCSVPDGDYYLSFDRKNPNGTYTEAAGKELVQAHKGIVAGKWEAVF